MYIRLKNIQKENFGSTIHIKRLLGNGNLVTASISNLQQFMNMQYDEIQQYFKSHFGSSPWVAYIKKRANFQ
jgi:hypothetical protein